MINSLPGHRFKICLLGWLLIAGCQVGPSISNRRALYENSLLDFRGLGVVRELDSVKLIGAVPEGWEPLPLKTTALYTHEQWRNPGGTTGAGVAYIHTLLPLPASAILWLAKSQYTKRENDGRLLGRWSDALGREWFEAENDKFHVRGYAVTRGFDAWIVYCGYKRANPPTPWDMSLATRSAETMAPG
jgi:hypothetical protein